MGLRAAWSGLLGRDVKASRAGPLLAIYGAGRPAPTPREYGKLALEGYQKNEVVFRCIDKIAKSAAAIPWQLFRGRGPQRTQIDDHPLLSLLAAPNPGQAGSEFFQCVYSFRLVAGNSYIEAVGPESGQNIGKPQELWCKRPDRMQVIKGDQGAPAGYQFSAGGRAVHWEVDPVSGRSLILHSKNFHPLDDWYGMAPLEAAAFEVDQHNAAGEWNYSLLKNSARPSGALIYAPTDGADVLDDLQKEAIIDELEAKFQGAGNAGRPPVLDGGFDWRPMSMTPVDMDWSKGRDDAARGIAMAFHVPPQLVGIPGSQTFANYEQAELSVYNDAVLPMVDGYKDDLNRWLVPAFGDDLEIGFDEDAIPALAPQREKKWNMVQAAGFLTINEQRAELGFDAIEGGDVLLVSATLLPLGAEPENEGADEEPTTPDDANNKLRLAYGGPGPAPKPDSPAA